MASGSMDEGSSMKKMQYCSWTIALLLVLIAPVRASFERDVLSSLRAKRATLSNEIDVHQALLSRAMPLADYEAMLHAKGLTMRRSLADKQEEEDDYYQNNGNNGEMYSFTGYSMRYAKCQPVQYFSEDAIRAGEHSPMLTQDVVVLRLCPQRSCSSNSQYGCHYNYAEYALSLPDYLGIMLRFANKKQAKLCDWCENCANGRRQLQEEENGGEGNNKNNQEGNNKNNQGEENHEGGEEEDHEEENKNDKEEERQADKDDDDHQANNNGDDYAGDDSSNNNPCNTYSAYCANYNKMCGDRDDDSTYMNYENFLDYLDCTQVNHNNYAYFVRPRCDGYKGTFKMAIYYDKYCVQYAGKEVSLNSLGLGFRETQFQEFYNGTCIDCSERDYPPYFHTSAAMCNKIHATGAKCTSDLLYDLFGGNADDSSECSYIESIRFGTYDEQGQLTAASSGKSWDAKVTTDQKVLLGAAIGIVVGLVFYACFLHHSMTNLLIKSLSHRELLPPSRQSSRRRSPRSRRGNSKTRSLQDDDWDGRGVMS